MKKLLLVLGLLGAVALARPAPARADFSLSIGLPGFGFFIAEPTPPPVYYAPPVYYRYRPPVAYYRPGPRYYYQPPRHRGRGRHYGWYKHHGYYD
jgi:hypothetical protein